MIFCFNLLNKYLNFLNLSRRRFQNPFARTFIVTSCALKVSWWYSSMLIMSPTLPILYRQKHDYTDIYKHANPNTQTSSLWLCPSSTGSIASVSFLELQHVHVGQLVSTWWTLEIRFRIQIRYQINIQHFRFVHPMKLLMSPSVSAQALFYQWQIWEETSRAVQ